MVFDLVKFVISSNSNLDNIASFKALKIMFSSTVKLGILLNNR